MATNLKLNFKWVWALGVMAFMVPVGGIAVAQESNAPEPVEAAPAIAKRLARQLADENDPTVDRNLIIGQKLVTLYSSIGRTLRKNSFLDPKSMKGGNCSLSSMSQLTEGVVRHLVKKEGEEFRRLAKAGDKSTLQNLAVLTVATFDDISPKAIVEDEAIGSGSYTDAIAGAVFVIQECDILGKI